MTAKSFAQAASFDSHTEKVFLSLKLAANLISVVLTISKCSTYGCPEKKCVRQSTELM